MRRKRKGICTNPKTEEFFQAAKEGDINKVKFIIKNEEVAIDARDPTDSWDQTALLIACEEQNVELAKVLVTATPDRADVNLENLHGQRPIWWAAKYGNAELAEVLLNFSKQNVEVNFLDQQSGCTPLYRSVLSNSTEVCRLLIHAGADVNLRKLGLGSIPESPLMKAVQLDNLEICELLVNSLCHLHAKTDDGLTALHYAVSYRRYEITEFLLKCRIKIMAQSSKGITAMTIAIEQHNPLMCKILIEFGYKMDVKFKWGETPLEMAIKFHSEECALTLVQWGCAIKCQKDKPSYFYMAASEGLTELVKLLIEINPYFLNEPWMRTKELPLALYQKQNFFEWLFKAASYPRSLQALCRAKIYQYLGKYPCSKINKLPIPSRLQLQLSHAYLVQDKMYYEKTLYTEECPFDCPSACAKLQCPALDFDSSDSDTSEIFPD